MLALHRELSAAGVDLGLAFEYPHVISIHNKLVQARLLQPDGQRILPNTNVVLGMNFRYFDDRLPSLKFYLSVCQARRNHTRRAVRSDAQENSRRQQYFRFSRFRAQGLPRFDHRGTNRLWT